MTETSTSTDAASVDVHAVADHVLTLMADIAEAEILPRFKALAAHEIIEKRPGDLVTAADHASELAFEDALPALIPGSIVLGEEGYEADPKNLDNLAGDAPVWIVDPVDGTHNFAHGETPFTVIVALAHRGETLAGWIIDPVTGQAVSAVQGHGAFYRDPHGETLRLGPSQRPFDQAVLVVGDRLRARINRVEASEKPICTQRYRCVGREYMDIAMGKLDLARYGGRLKPWDHAAGCLIVTEAGGVASWLDDAHPYRVTSTLPERTLAIAGAQDLWPPLREIVTRADSLISSTG